jgi:hypothetical protein
VSRPRSPSPRARFAVIAPAVAALAIAGCGGARAHSPTSAARDRGSVRGAGVPASAIAVIEGWANALRNGHVKRAAAYWADPSILVNGPDSSGHYTVIRIETEAQALAADETLPCGARLRSSARSGAFIKADFTLGPRAGVAASKACAGSASVDFLIREGLIVHWIRAPLRSSAPGEPAVPAAESTAV